MVEALDVVARLGAHQANLVPAAAPRRAVLLALPMPPLCARVAPEAFARLRTRALADLAERLGGGDGPLPCVDLQGRGEPLPRLLDALAADGAEDLFLYDHREQPGFARAVAARWPGGVFPVGAGSLAPLLDDPAPVVWLSEEVACVRSLPDARTLPGARTILLSVAAGDAPPAGLEHPDARDVIPVAADPRRAVAPWSGFLPEAGRHGTSRGERLRSAWSKIWVARGASDAVRCAALGLDPRLESALRVAPERSGTGRPPVFVVTGLDGSGKSTHADRLCASLRQRGFRAGPLKIYRQGAFLELANELGARTRRGAPLAAFRVSRIVKLVDSLRTLRDTLGPALAGWDALVMDRYVETHVAAAGSQLGWDLRGHPILAAFPPAEGYFWLEVPVAVALARLEERAESLSADEHAVGLRGYAQVFERLAAEEGGVRLDSGAALEANAEAIASRALARLGAPRPGPVEPDPPAPPAAAALPVRTCRVRLGVPGAGPELGGDVPALRLFLVETVGRCAEGVDERFWLEAYAAQLLLDLRTSAPDEAWAALWPGALARMPSLRDAPMLAELDRMLAACTRVACCATGRADEAERLFAALGASAHGAHRLAREYLAQLAELARAAGWPEG